MQEDFELQKQELQNQINAFCEHLAAIKQEIQKKDEKIIDLHKDIESRKAAFIEAKKSQWNEYKKINSFDSFKLIKDIERIQADVGAVVNMTKQADEFHYKNYKISDGNEKLSYILQRFIVRRVFYFVENIAEICEFENKHKEEFVEQFIIYHTQELCMLAEKLSTHRVGSDGFTCITPIKIRQQVCAALGARGFHKKEWHPTIKLLGDIIIDQLNQSRKLPQEMNEEMQARIYDLVLELLKLRFRIDTQEPIPELRWFKTGEPIHVGLMDVKDNEELEVDLCYFPVIGAFLDDPNPQNRRIYFKAQVLTRTKKHDQSDRRDRSGDLVKNAWNSLPKKLF
ncbi:14214_t:CDS:1 [Ambispora leptoticha]|uniref:14214_t:CDS:1 n=1 Tax=Ambispora leptoticha TaxID=144679 RepID=A0A9N9DE99_9GLOM|nr:14214_t:CDS:1 [Ambispora leptoticha]